MGRVIYISYSGMEGIKTNINSALIECQSMKRNINLSLSKVSGTSSNVQGIAGSIQESYSKVTHNIDKLQDLKRKIDLTVTKFKEVDARCAAKMRNVHFMEWYSKNLWEGSPYTKHDLFGKGIEAFNLSKSIYYGARYRNTFSIHSANTNLYFGRSYVRVSGDENLDFIRNLMDKDVSQFRRCYDFDKIKRYVNEGKRLSNVEIKLAETFIPKVAAKSGLKSAFKGFGLFSTVGTVGIELYNDIKAKKDVSQIVADVGTEVAIGAGSAATGAAAGAAIGSIVPVAGNIVGATVGFVVGVGIDFVLNGDLDGNKKTLKDDIKWGVGRVTKKIGDLFSD